MNDGEMKTKQPFISFSKKSLLANIGSLFKKLSVKNE